MASSIRCLLYNSVATILVFVVFICCSYVSKISGKGFPPSIFHCHDDIMSVMAFRIIGVSIVYSNVCSGADQRKHQSSASLAFVRGIHRSPVNSPHKGPVTRKMLPFDDVIMGSLLFFHSVAQRDLLAKYNDGVLKWNRFYQH